MPARSLQVCKSEADADLAGWVRNHAFLRPVPVEEGESGMALLLLWEVDHGCPFPTLAVASQASILCSFTRRLKDRVARDDELREWLVCKYMQMTLSPGLPTSLQVVCEDLLSTWRPGGWLVQDFYREVEELPAKPDSASGRSRGSLLLHLSGELLIQQDYPLQGQDGGCLPAGPLQAYEGSPASEASVKPGS